MIWLRLVVLIPLLRLLLVASAFSTGGIHGFTYFPFAGQVCWAYSISLGLLAVGFSRNIFKSRLVADGFLNLRVSIRVSSVLSLQSPIRALCSAQS